MHPLAKKLLVSRQFQIEEGVLEVLGSRMVMFNAQALVELDTVLDERKAYEIGKVVGKNIAGSLDKFGMKGDRLVEFAMNLISLYGWGRPEIKRMGRPAFIDVVDSVVAKSTLVSRKGTHTKERVCHILAGIFAGIFSQARNTDSDAKEVKCLAKGEKICEFEIK